MLVGTVPAAYHMLGTKQKFLQFPHAPPPQHPVIILVLSIGLFVLLGIVHFLTQQSAGINVGEVSYRQTEGRLAYWQQKTREHPNWRDAWVELARYAYMLHRDQEMRVAVTQALRIDPNYPPAHALNRLMQNP